MPLDTFICGTCQETFTDLSEFVNHKQRSCASQGQPASAGGAGQSPQETELIQLHLNESGEITGMTAQGLDEDDNKGADGSGLTFLNGVDMGPELAGGALEGKDGVNTRTTHLIILNSSVNGEGDGGDGSITLLNNVSLEGLTDGQFAAPGNTNATMTVDQLPVSSTIEPSQTPAENQGENAQQIKKRRGRGKAGESKSKALEAVPPSTPRPTVPETDADGKLVCPQCKRTFTKERHFNTHKCLASSSYVDITKKEMKIDSGDEDGGETELDLDAAARDDDDDDEDFTAAKDENAAKEEHEDDKEMDKESDQGGRKRRRGKKRKRSSYQFEVDVLTENEGAKQMKMAAESMENLPIFKNEEEKTEFESCVDVDLSQVDHMFRIHIIEQELNEMSGMVYNTPTMSSLSVYSCNVCDKVFKSLSHIRLHCVTHTEIKPFKCTKCSYATNSKGNLYTHMRKHTGQFYRCGQCDFKTVNKSHLVEHQMIHSERRAQCLLCQKDYSTLKSLINHVRKYHTDTKGKEYLQTFLQGRGAKGTTVIHQCHVCNRKFKKRIDRDRHLFIHDIKDLPHVQQCELCDYWASRRVYLDKHYLKHRVIYCCSLCDQKFLSTARLSKHLGEVHSDQGEPDALLTDSINRSLYLPEPLVTSQEGSKYVNLPVELRETPISPTDETTSVPQPAEGVPQVTASSGSVINDPNLNIQEQRPSGEADGEAPSLFVSSTGYNNDDSNAVDNPSSILKEGEECGGQTHPEDIEGHGVVSDEGLDRVLSSAVKLNLEELGEQAQETSLSLELGESEKGGDVNLMMMLQNPGSDSDQDGEGETEDRKEAPREDEGETHGKVIAVDSSTVTEQNADPTASGPGSNGDAAENSEAVEKADDETNTHPEEVKQAESGTGVGDTAEQADAAPDSKEKKIQALIQRLGYRKMSTEIFHKMRETFGSVECEYCGRLFYSKVDYEPHLRTHTGDKPFACTNCSFRGNTKEQLRKHCEREHEKVAFQCKECDFLAPTRTRLWNHQLKHLGINGLACPECPSKFDGMKQLRAHILNSHKDMDKDAMEKLTGYRQKALGKIGRRSFKCPHCPRVFIRANSELQKHIWIHEGIKPYTCPICPYACRSKNNLQAHMLRHSAEKPFSCSECGKEYKSKTALRWHVRSHKTGKLFKCDKCSYEATQASHLKRHMETHEVLKRFLCKHCDYSANTLGYMKIHYAKHHKGQAFSHEEIQDPDAAMSDKRVYKCLSCGYLFGNLSDLKRHLKIRHHVLMQDIADIRQMQVSEVEVMQYEDPSAVVASTTDVVTSQPIQPQAQLPATPAPGAPGEIQLEMPGGDAGQGLSAVSLIQHIMGLSQLGDGQVRVVSEDGQPLEIAPETIVLRQDGQLLLSGDGAGSILPGNQFVIQYYNPEDAPPTDATANNVDNAGTEVQLVSGSQQQQSLQQDQQQQQQQQFQQHQQQQQQQQQQFQHQQQQQLIVGPGAPSNHDQSASGAQYIINSVDNSTPQSASGAQYIINRVDNSTPQIIPGVQGPGQVVTVDSQGNIVLPVAAEGTAGTGQVQFMSAVSGDAGVGSVVEMDDADGYGSRMIITSEQGEPLVIGEAGGAADVGQAPQVQEMEVSGTAVG